VSADIWFLNVSVGLVVLACLSSLIFYQRAVVRGEAISASLHWGGLGGGTGGWRVTTALVTLVAALLLWAVAAAMAVYWFQARREDARTELTNRRADEAVRLKNAREDAKSALDEKHREQERVEREAERTRSKPQTPNPAPSANP
jgi:hypothetical protein